MKVNKHYCFNQGSTKCNAKFSLFCSKTDEQGNHDINSFNSMHKSIVILAVN